MSGLVADPLTGAVAALSGTISTQAGFTFSAFFCKVEINSRTQ
jgi:hypothetical protein